MCLRIHRTAGSMAGGLQRGYAKSEGRRSVGQFFAGRHPALDRSSRRRKRCLARHLPVMKLAVNLPEKKFARHL
jgi:hypothetical protein